MGKKIAIITTHPIQYYAPLFKLLAQGIELKVFYTWGKDSVEKYDPGFGKKVQWDVPLLEGYDYQYLENTAKEPGSHHFKGIKNPTIIEEILDYNPAAIMVIGWCYNSHLKVLLYFKGKLPIYFRGDSTLLKNKKNLVSSLKLFSRKLSLYWVYKHIDKAFYVGTENKAYFKWVGLKDKQLIFAPHSIDNNRFANISVEKNLNLRNELSIPNDDRILLFAGKLESTKSPILLIESFIEAKTEKIHLVFLGNGKEEEILKTMASKSTKSKFIHFVDFQNQSKMPFWYKFADIFCLSSKGETWGLVINEAMACSKAVIVSDKVGCAKDLVFNKLNGWTFESGNKHELQAVIQNLPSKEVLEEMGRESKKIIEKWGLEVTANCILKEWRNN